MKLQDFTSVCAVTIDQRGSRRDDDRVPRLLDVLATALDGRAVLAPERTAGDEVQLLVADPSAVVDVVAAVAREGRWWTGIGLGAVEHPLPDSTRAARGPAYLAAREAVEAARHQPGGLALRTVGAEPYGGAMSSTTGDAETSLLLLADLLDRRSPQGWEVVDLLAAGASVAGAARALGVSPSAVSQRHRRAGWELEVRARALAAGCLGRALAQAAA